MARVKCIRETGIATALSVTRVVPREYDNPVPEYESIPGLFAWLQIELFREGFRTTTDVE